MTFQAIAAVQGGFWYTSSMDTKQNSFEALYEKYAPEIKRFLFTISPRDPEATNDVFQNTWINVWRYFESLKDKNAARAWLYSIAKNEAKRYYSSRSNEPVFEPIYQDEEGRYDEPWDEAESHFPDALCDADQLKGLLVQLSESDQQLILLHFLYGIAVSEIAELRGTNYNTAKSQLRRALTKLREIAG